MGEAKRRAANRPDVRGLVMTSISREGDGLRLDGSLDRQALRHALLLFDKIAWPNSNIMRVESGPDEEYLTTAGIMTRPDVRLHVNGDIGSLVDLAHAVAFEQLERSAPGGWALAQGLDTSLRSRGLLIDNHGVAVQLNAAIPVPNEDVPFEAILEFKQRRNAELAQLRAEIDRLETAINSSNDSAGELDTCISRIDEACAQMIRIGSEWQFPVRLTNVKSSFEIRPLVTSLAGLAGYLAANASHLPLSQSAVAAIGGALTATAPAIKLSADFGWRGLRPRPSPYRYVYSFHRELF